MAQLFNQPHYTEAQTGKNAWHKIGSDDSQRMYSQMIDVPDKFFCWSLPRQRAKSIFGLGNYGKTSKDLAKWLMLSGEEQPTKIHDQYHNCDKQP